MCAVILGTPSLILIERATPGLDVAVLIISFFITVMPLNHMNHSVAYHPPIPRQVYNLYNHYIQHSLMHAYMLTQCNFVCTFST